MESNSPNPPNPANPNGTSEPTLPQEERMPLWEHLDELRGALIRSLIAVALCLVLTYNFSDRIMYFLELPLLKILPAEDARLVFTGIADKFMVYFKVSLLSAAFLALPIILYQLWGFIRPALYVHERKFAAPFIFLGTLAFFGGLAFAYYIVIPYGYKFLIEFGNADLPHAEKPMITLTEYFSLTMKLMLAIGILFETPVILVLLGRFGIVSAKMLTKFRRHAIVACAVISAIATPSPDAFTMLIVMFPLWGLYELSIIGVRLTGRKE